MPTSLKDANIPDDRIEEMAEKCTEKGPVGSFKKLYKDDVVEILKITVENTTTINKLNSEIINIQSMSLEFPKQK